MHTSTVHTLEFHLLYIFAYITIIFYFAIQFRGSLHWKKCNNFKMYAPNNRVSKFTAIFYKIKLKIDKTIITVGNCKTSHSAMVRTRK